MSIFFKLDFNKIEICVIYIYIYILSGTLSVEFHLNFQKHLSDKICIELDISNFEFNL